ncbi:hypothetical protein HDU84_006000 [Entophlyctis sp. JEL0112]|nr:hypothetical protein HDU84_006000 [Entophlyctis sp. JEL0112]
MKTNQKATLIELGLEKLSTVLHYHRLATGFKAFTDLRRKSMELDQISTRFIREKISHHTLIIPDLESIGLLEWNIISLHFKVWLNLFKQRIVATKFLETKTAARSVHKWIVKLVS